MTPDIYLSICIPTYNRAGYLEKCLQSIVKQVGNNAEVEVIISDNVSTDHTCAMVEGYAKEFTNIKYFKNETNIGGDKNIMQVLKLGNGKFLKLLNEYLEFKDGCLLKMLEIVKTYAENKEVLFFANGLSHLKKKDFYYSDNVDGFLKIATDRSTWIGSFGIWRDDFWYLLQRTNFKTNNLLQTELLFESVWLKKKAVTYSRYIYVINSVQNKKTGYNFFDVFVNDYFNKIIVGLKNDKKISYFTYFIEKNKFFANFVWMWFKKIKIKKDDSTTFNSDGMYGIIFKTYKYYPVLYLYILFLPFYLIVFYIKKLIR